jgi:hypothetical protein
VWTSAGRGSLIGQKPPDRELWLHWESRPKGALSGSLGRGWIPRSSSATYIAHKLIDAEFSVGDDAFHEIADRYYPYETSVTQDWQVSDSFLGHESHTNFGGLTWFHVNYVRFHDLAN